MDNNDRLVEGKRVTWIGIIVNILLTITKAIIGFIAGSTAMVADSAHSASDIISSVIVLQGIKVSHLPPDDEHHYGHGKAESIVAKIIAILLVVTAFGIGWSAFQSLINPDLQPPRIIAIYAAILSIIVKEWMYRYTAKVGKKINSEAIIADALDHRTDVFSSIAALIGIGGAVIGFPILDPLAGIAVSIIILKTGFSIYWEAVTALMDTAPSKKVMQEVENISLSIEGIKSVHEIKARKHGGQVLVDMKICVDKDLTVERGHHLASKAKHALISANKNIKDVLIHVNPCKDNNDNMNN